MPAPPAATSRGATIDRDALGGTRLHRRWLVLARLLWAALVVLALGLFAASLPNHYASLLSLADVAEEEALRHLGLSVSVRAGYLLALVVVQALIFCAVAAVIVWRRSDDWMALFVSLTLVIWGVTSTGTLYQLVELHPVWETPILLLNVLGLMAFFFCFYLFPDGRFRPRWTRWLALVWVVGLSLGHVLPLERIGELIVAAIPGELVWMLMISGWLGSCVFAQIQRYRHHSGPVQRQQTKWVVFGLTAMLAIFLVTLLLRELIPALNQPGSPQALYDLVSALLLTGAALLLPLSIGFAILRYRLWEIDVLINRALVYGMLTALLLAIYFVSVVLLQGLFRMLVGQESNVAVVISTLTAAALFQPVRARLQAFIDQRFYRRKYDAAQTLAAFSARLQDEVELAALTEELVRAVDETMQPSHVSLWLRQPTRPPSGPK